MKIFLLVLALILSVAGCYRPVSSAVQICNDSVGACVCEGYDPNKAMFVGCMCSCATVVVKHK